MSELINTLALELNQAGINKQPIDPIREQIKGGIAEAYAIQQTNVQRLVNEGHRITGRKIGLTSLAVQKQLKVDQPDFGTLFETMAISDGEEINVSSVMQPKCEAEVAFVLERDLNKANVTLTDLISSIAYALPAIEVVDSRISNWDINILDTIADNASSGLYVLGHTPVKLNHLDLRLAGMVMERKGEQVSLGVGASCLGHPLNAALWLARTMIENNTPLKAGDVILSGALGPLVPASPGDVFEARIQGLGSVRACFGHSS